MRFGRSRVLLALVVLTVASCGGRDEGSSTTLPPAATTTEATVASSTTTSLPPTTTTITIDPCDLAPIVALADRVIDDARLSPGSTWTDGIEGSTFVVEVVEPDVFAAGLGLGCSVRMISDPGGDHERVLLAAWTGARAGLVVLAVDQPTEAFDELIRVDLLFEAPDGEWVAADTWAATVSTGESVILHTNDYALGPVAKSFLVAFPEPPSPPPETTSEEYAMSSLEFAGAQNVGIAEPSHGSQVASIAFVTPAGNTMIATVGPFKGFTPEAGYLTGDRTVTSVGDVDVILTLPGAGQFVVGEAAFACGPWGWRLESGFGAPEELTEFATLLIETVGC